MSSPSPPAVVLVQPEAVAALSTELVALAAELHDDADRCRDAAGSLSTALDGDDGWTAGGAATAWAGLEDVLADRAAALAQLLGTAAEAYRDAEAQIAGAIDAAEGPR